MAKLIAPSLRAGWKPFGIGETKPDPLRGMVGTAWENKRHPLYAWRVLNKGVCDGCALGTTGMRDWTIDSIHLCTIRLNLLKLNTMDPLPWKRLTKDVAGLKTLSSAELRDLGRLPYPMVQRRGEANFSRVSWDQALDLVAGRITETPPERLAFYMTSRGITNEVYYAAQKAARFIGTNNVDNSARVCHSPTTSALKDAIGVAATTCSYRDVIESDLIVLFGSDVANAQPVFMKYLYLAKQRGARVAVVNPMREPGLEHYWVPSNVESALFGTKVADEFFSIHTGGDVAFVNGVLKQLLAAGCSEP